MKKTKFFLLQTEVDSAVKQLLSLKSDYKKAAGEDWKPEQAPPASSPGPAAAPSGGASALDLHNKIVEQGNTVRDLKTKKAGKVEYMHIIQYSIITLLASIIDYLLPLHTGHHTTYLRHRKIIGKKVGNSMITMGFPI